MPTIDSANLEDLTAEIFERAGAPAAEARVVAELLVKADLMGLPSHGVLRIPQYVHDTTTGAIRPGAEMVIDQRRPTIHRVDGAWNFGQIAATRAAEIAIDAAVEQGMAGASVRRVRHVGRVGAYTEMAAARDCLALATCSGAGEGHWVAPFGGRKGRLGTNPISFAAPTGGLPIVMDFSTSSLPEGKVRYLRDTGEKLPPDTLVDADGNLSLDPADLYTESNEPAGAILPAGGSQGYKGYGLSLMCAVLSCMVGEPTWLEEGIESHANCMWIMVISLDSAMAADLFRDEMDKFVDYVLSSPPAAGSTGPMLPGQREFATMDRHLRDGVPVADGVWGQVRRVAADLGCEVGEV